MGLITCGDKCCMIFSLFILACFRYNDDVMERDFGHVFVSVPTLGESIYLFVFEHNPMIVVRDLSQIVVTR